MGARDPQVNPFSCWSDADVGEDGIIIVRQARQSKKSGWSAHHINSVLLKAKDFFFEQLEIYISLFLSIYQVPTALQTEENHTTLLFF
jgi:hypothetical protein